MAISLYDVLASATQRASAITLRANLIPASSLADDEKLRNARLALILAARQCNSNASYVPFFINDSPPTNSQAAHY